MEIYLRTQAIKSIAVAPHLDYEHGAFAVVRVVANGGADISVGGEQGIRRARELASALNAAAEAVEDAERKAAAVDIRSLAPDVPEPVDSALAEAVEVERG